MALHEGQQLNDNVMHVYLQLLSSDGSGDKLQQGVLPLFLATHLQSAILMALCTRKFHRRDIDGLLSLLTSIVNYRRLQ